MSGTHGTGQVWRGHRTDWSGNGKYQKGTTVTCLIQLHEAKINVIFLSGVRSYYDIGLMYCYL